MKSKNSAAVFLSSTFALLLALPACSDSPSGSNDLAVTTSDHEASGTVIAAHTAAAIATVIIPVINIVLPAASLAAASVTTAVPISIPVDRTSSCPSGGSVRSTGSLAGDLSIGGSGSLAVQLTQSLSACVIVVDVHSITVNSDPTLAVTGSYVVANRVPANSQTARVTGRVLVKVNDSRAPAVPCTVDVTASYAPSTRTGTATGSVCGTSVNKSITWTP